MILVEDDPDLVLHAVAINREEESGLLLHPISQPANYECVYNKRLWVLHSEYQS